jgi:hypothetical protein
MPISLSSSEVNNIFTIEARKVMESKNMTKIIQVSSTESIVAASYRPSYARANKNFPTAGRVFT